MEESSDLELFAKCRLCGANGLHEIDILANNLLKEPKTTSALSEKIFRCVGIRVSIVISIEIFQWKYKANSFHLLISLTDQNK